jgi:hypothetical protein
MNNQDALKTAELLAMLKPGYLPYPIFHQFVRLATTPIIELVPLRIAVNGDVEVLLKKRSTDDPIWPNQLHTPGTVIRATDTSYETALERIMNDELHLAQHQTPVFVKNVLHNSGRGLESALVYFVEITSEPKDGAFYNTKSLPNTLVKSQLDFIPDAVLHFKSTTPTS